MALSHVYFCVRGFCLRTLICPLSGRHWDANCFSFYLQGQKRDIQY